MPGCSGRSGVMSETIYYELRLAGSSVATGAGLMMVYDLLRIFRMICPHGSIAVSAEDLCYWIYCAVMTFGLLYEQNNGALRGYVIAGTLLGMAVYQHTVSAILLKYLKKGQESIRIRLKKRRRRRNR